LEKIVKFYVKCKKTVNLATENHKKNCKMSLKNAKIVNAVT